MYAKGTNMQLGYDYKSPSIGDDDNDIISIISDNDL
jgi:hypothetical protein